MKNFLRVIALSSVVPAVLAGSTLTRNKPAVADKTVAVMHRATVPGPIPVCNPFTQTCPNVRER